MGTRVARNRESRVRCVHRSLPELWAASVRLWQTFLWLQLLQVFSGDFRMTDKTSRLVAFERRTGHIVNQYQSAKSRMDSAVHHI